MEYNATMLCVQCLRMQVDVTEGLPSSVDCFRCQESLAWCFPNGRWTFAELESRELMAMCLKAIKVR